MKFEKMLFVVGFAALATGCATRYTGLTMAGDDLTDDANRAYAAQAQKAYEARMNAPARPVVITEAPGMNLFLGPKSPFAGHPLCSDLGVRKEVALAFKSALRDKVSSIKDFRLVDEAPQPLVAVGDELRQTAPTNYRMTYNITSLELKENASGSLATGLIGSAVGGNAGQQVATQKFWDGVATVEVRLFKPDGVTPIFSFTGKGVYNKMVSAYAPIDKTFLIEAVKLAANNAMEKYAQKFEVPIFVTDTCQGGAYARLNIGSRLGAQRNMRVEFFQNVVRKGLNGEDEQARRVIGCGIIGARRAPVEPDGAWVYLERFDPERRTVFRWTSAHLIQSER